VDFAEGMLKLAREKNAGSQFSHQCSFLLADFLKPPLSPQIKFDCALVLGVMDYIGNPKDFINRVLQFTQAKAFFSFPKDGGALVLLRKAIYQHRCSLLFLYTLEQINNLFRDFADGKQVTIEDIGKEFFVTVGIK
jgi:ubiquinone/menaquinone biosynthesis C-methylase UbiE